MKVKMTKELLQAYKGMAIPYTYLEIEDSNKLAIIFPGLGYTTQGPLLYYSTSTLVSLGYSVVHINYPYNETTFSSYSKEEQIECIRFNSKLVIDFFLTGKNYSHTVILGKSIGTAGMASIVEQPAISESTLIWLTPLLPKDDVYEAMKSCRNKSLAIIGDQDTVFDQPRWDELQNLSHIETLLINGADHSLDIKMNPIESIQVLKKVLEKVKDFIKK